MPRGFGVIATIANSSDYSEASRIVDLGIAFALGQMQASGEDFTDETLQNKLAELLLSDQNFCSALMRKACADAALAHLGKVR